MVSNLRKISLIFLLFIFSNLRGQIDCSITGYISDFPIYQKTTALLTDLLQLKQNLFYNLTRLRIRPEIYPWDNSKLALELETTLIYSSFKGLFELQTTTPQNHQILDLTWNIAEGKDINFTSTIDRLYFRQGFSQGEITVGRQRISWGTGRVWNPTDLFNPINPANFYKVEKDGADAISGKIFLSNFTDLNIVFNPGVKIKDSNYGARFRTNLNEYDLSMMAGLFDERKVIGIDFAGNFYDAGLRGEGIWSQNREYSFAKFILGADYQFSMKFYAMLEYHFNGAGQSDKFNYDLEQLITGQILNLSRHYIYLSALYQYHPLISISLMNNFNILDGSGFFGAIWNYSISDNVMINLGTQITYGDEFTEYWYFPVSMYGRIEIYF